MVVVVAVGVALAWFLVGKREVPREAPQDVSFATRAARADLYGDAINDGLVVGPAAGSSPACSPSTRYGVDGVVTGGPLAVGGHRRRSCAACRTASSAPTPCPCSAACCSSSWPCWR